MAIASDFAEHNEEGRIIPPNYLHILFLMVDSLVRNRFKEEVKLEEK
jgi:hypothetical protein